MAGYPYLCIVSFNTGQMSEEHYLHSYLAEILPALGLDVETYAPYVTAADTDENSDDFDEIIELLKASSESHGEDDDAWDNFKKEIMRRREEYISGETVRKVCLVYIRTSYDMYVI